MCAYSHSSPAIHTETLQNAVTELKEEDEEEEEETERTVASATSHIAVATTKQAVLYS